jgi:hypothetical protein
VFNFVKDLLNKNPITNTQKELDTEEIIPILYMLCNVRGTTEHHKVICNSLQYLFFVKPCHLFKLLYFKLPKQGFFKYDKTTSKVKVSKTGDLEQIGHVLGMSSRKVDYYKKLLSVLVQPEGES